MKISIPTIIIVILAILVGVMLGKMAIDEADTQYNISSRARICEMRTKSAQMCADMNRLGVE